MRSTVAAQVGYYVERLALQYRDKSRARETVAIAAKQILADDLAGQLQQAFNVDTAVGAQLDVIGIIVGVSRNIGSSTPPPLFSLWTYASALDPAKYQGTWDPASDTPTIPAASGGNTGFWYVASATGTSTTPIAESFRAGDIIVSDGSAWAKQTTDCGNGLTTYSDPAVNLNGQFWSYAAASRAYTNLTDASYRTVIKLKIILNSNDGTLSAIMAALWTFFPNLIFLTDNADMTLSYRVVSTVPLSLDVLEQFLPKPMGVGINVTIISPVPGDSGRLTTEGGDIITTEDGTPISLEP